MSAHSFDDKAATWDDETKITRSQNVARVIADTVDIDPDTRLLEYGAGTGLVTQALLDNVASVTLADPSSGMRDMMHAKVAAGTLPAEAKIWSVDLSKDPLPDERFDLIVTVLTLHHIPTVEPVLEAFAELLDDGGHLCVVDLDEEDGSFHTDGSNIHDGFSRPKIAAAIETAGFSDVSVVDCGEIDRDGQPYSLFLAVGGR